LTNPFLNNWGIEKCSDELQQPLVLGAFGKAARLVVMVGSIEKQFATAL
jgi:hypothetical protein